MPRLAWFTIDEEVNRLVDPTYESDGNATLNTLFIKTLKRSHFGQTFACVASNNNATQPVATNVTIDMRCELDHFSFYSAFLLLEFQFTTYFVFRQVILLLD